MKKYLVLSLIFFSACNNPQATIEEQSVPTSTTVIENSTTTSTVKDESELMSENFHNWWKAYKLKENTKQTSQESDATQEIISQFVIDSRDTESDPNYFYPFDDNPFSTVVVYLQPGTEFEEFIVCTKQIGASGLAVADENHPLQRSNNLPYVVSSSYVCDDEEVDFLWGMPFLQDGKWWIFRTIPRSERIITDNECVDPCGYTYTHWATRTKFQPIRGVFGDDNGEQITFLPDFSDKYENKTYEVDYEYVDFTIFYPRINFNETCADVMEEDILSVVDAAVTERIDTVDTYRESDDLSDEEKEGGWDWLNLSYDIIEINDDLVSVMYRWNSYSFGAAHPQDWYFSRNYIIDSDENGTECFKVDIQKEMGGTFDYERGIDFQPKIYEFIYQQLCLGNDNNYFGCEDKGWVDSPNRENDDRYLYKLHLFEDITPEVQFAFSRLGLLIQFQNYSIGSYADGAPRIIIPNSNYFMYNNNYRLSYIVKDMMCYQDKDKPTAYEPQFIVKTLCRLRS